MGSANRASADDACYGSGSGHGLADETAALLGERACGGLSLCDATSAGTQHATALKIHDFGAASKFMHKNDRISVKKLTKKSIY